MKIVYVDDNPRDVERIRAQLPGRDLVGCNDAASFRETALRLNEPFIAIIDHDLKGTEWGYDLCAWLRAEHPYGLILPVVYLTGRDDERHFLQKLREAPYSVPNAFVHKDDRIALDALVPLLEEKFERALGQLREQMARSAVLELERLPREEIEDA